MALDFIQTNTVNTSNTWLGCTGRSGTGLANNWRMLCDPSGTQGSSGVGVVNNNLNASGSLLVTGLMRLVVPAGANWDSGTWTWRAVVSIADMNVTLNEVHICRLNSSGVNQATIGSATGLGISLGSTGLKSGNISGSAQSPGVGDIVGVFFVCTNGSSMTAASAYFDASSFISSPFTLPIRTPRPLSCGHPFIV